MNSCPLPHRNFERVLMGHGSGGRLTQRLLDEVVLPLFDREQVNDHHDGATLELPGGPLAFSTDSFVVTPIFFAGGDIGKLAVYGTVNDLAMCGAKPRYLSCSLIIEEGFLISDLRRVISSMAEAAKECGVRIATGDTKVVEKGKGDGIFINTSGVGEILRSSKPQNIRPGDQVILSGDVGRHGLAVIASRQNFESDLKSDCQDLSKVVLEIIKSGFEFHCLRDLTRGGLATNLRELAVSSSCGIVLHEQTIPVCDSVRGACEILGIDPLYSACEGRMVLIAPKASSSLLLEFLSGHPCASDPRIIGEVVQDGRDPLVLRSEWGSERILESLMYEQLPRIC